MNWDDLRVALAIGRAGSITRAADVLGINQSTATRRLVALEAALGTSLFIRTKSGLVPTESGEAAIKRATEVEVRLERLSDQIATDTSNPAGLVRLHGASWVLEHLTATGMRAFLDATPGIALRTASDDPDNLRRGASVSLWFDRTPRELEFPVKLGAVPYAVYAALDHDVEALDWVIYLDEDAPGLSPTRHAERLRGRNSVRLASTDVPAMVEAVAAGIGKALLPVCLAERDPRLVRVNPGPFELTRFLHMHLHPDTVQVARIQAVIRWLREIFETTFGAELASRKA